MTATIASQPATEPLAMNILSWLRAHAGKLAVEGAINIALPVLIFNDVQPHWGDTYALMASSVPPLLWGLGGFARDRRVDALSVLALIGIALSLLTFIGGGSAQLMALKEKFVTLLFAFAFLLSAIIGKPLIYPLARATMARQSKEEGERFDARRNEASVRHTVTVMTWVWGLGLLIDGLLSILLVYSVPMTAYLIVGPILGYATIGGLTLWTIVYRRYRTRKVAQQRA